MQRLGQEVSGNVLVPCAYLFTIIPAFAATAHFQHPAHVPEGSRFVISF